MAYIDKLMIMGVRAFPTQQGETIKFEPPLTLVAGINGSGKTTIIECLRFATTGALPPGAGLKGAWIHDPGLVGEKKQLAQVRLMFHSANGTRLVVTRSLVLEVKKATRSQTAKEALLLIERHGQKTTLSTRVAELDQQVPLYLGVSPSLLDNVLFCHQEDSQWPLAESGTLKKKFDEIFEAGKYTKAVKELVDIRKKHRNDLGRQGEVVNSAKKDRERSKKVKQQTDNLGKEVHELREEARDLEKKMESALREANESLKKSEEFSEILGQLEQYRIEANSKDQSLEDLKVHLKVLPETDEWLQNALAQFNDTLSRYEEEKENKTEQWHEYKEELEELNKRLEKKLAEQGQYQQEKAENERQLERRRAQITESAVQHQIRGYDDVSDDSKVEDFMFKIKKMSKDRSAKLDRARQEADNEKREAVTQVNRLTERQRALKDNRISASRQIAENNRQAGQRQSEADAINVNEGSKAAIESRMEELQTRLGTTRDNMKAADYPTKIKQADLEILALDEEASRLNSELVQGTKRAGEVAQLSHVKQELKEKERSLNTLVKAHGNKINKTVGNDWSARTLEAKFKDVSSEAAKQVSSAERERDSTLREAEQVQYKQKTVRDELNSKKRQETEHEAAVRNAIDDEDITEYEDSLRQAELRLDTARASEKEYAGLSIYFGRVLETADTNHACRLCDRPFKAEGAQLEKFKTKIQALIKKAALTELEAETQAATEDHKIITNSAVDYENWKRLTKTDIPALEKQMAKLEKDHEKLLAQVETQDKKVEERESAQKEVDGLALTVSSIVKTEQDVKSLNVKVEELTAKQSQHGEVKTLEDIDEEINAVKGRIQEAKRASSRLNNEQNTAKSEVYAMELELGELRNEISTVSRSLDRKTALLDRVQEFKDSNQKQRETIDKIDGELEKLGPEIDTARVKQDDIDQRSDAQLKELVKEARSFDETVSGLQFIDEQIRAYIDGGGESRLSRAVREVEHIRQESSKYSAAQAQLTKELSHVDQQIKDGGNTKRSYADNLRYRQDSRRVKDLRGQIEVLESQNAEYDRDELQRMSQHKMKQYHNYSGQREGVIGMLKGKDNELKRLRTEYDTDLKGAALRYKEAHIKFESTKAAIEDIGKYSTALDQAVTKYHSLKMEEVNGIIDELWRATYMGTDVDTIYITSNLEVKANTRVHNYRVVMLKRDIELDMRGRCSAGQKVLASIIIRLALAECFSKDCGVIALDEPTTNLDEKNIEALAVSLHRIIEARRHQKNFQLIIITHDEHFLELMNCSDFTDHYYLVRRNEKDDSVIERQSILDVMRK